jgi:PAS domain S-box-containing protein
MGLWQHHVDGDLSRLIETVNAPVFGVSVEGLATEWNRKAVELPGFINKEIMGHSLVDEFVMSDYREQVRMVVAEASEGREATRWSRKPERRSKVSTRRWNHCARKSRSLTAESAPRRFLKP